MGCSNSKNTDISFYESADFFSFEDRIIEAYVCKVYDGDTIHAIFKHEDKYQKFKIRMLGYNSPELKPSRKIKNRDIIIKNAKKSRDRLSDLIFRKVVKLDCGKFDKYGRILATVYFNNNNINKIMLDENLGVVY
jgi:micrococcal nuclease